MPVDGTSTVVRQEPGVIYSYRVTATNAGGESFPSETLSAAWVPEPKGRVLVVNGFDRVSAPLSIQGDSLAGFYRRLDSGVADRHDISFIGEQRVFDRRFTEAENDEEALGSCYSDYATQVIGGNTFDYPRLHGASIVRAGYSFCSASAAALAAGAVKTDDYFFMDVIFGKQRSVEMGRGTSGVEFRVFPEGLRRALGEFTASGRSLFVSGSFIATDPWRSPASTDEERAFVKSVLRYDYRGGQASRRGEARIVASPARMDRERFYFNTEPCRDFYPVEGSRRAASGRGWVHRHAVRRRRPDRRRGLHGRLPFAGDGIPVRGDRRRGAARPADAADHEFSRTAQIVCLQQIK